MSPALCPSLYRIIELNGGQPPLTYKRFQTLISRLDPPELPVEALSDSLMGRCVTPVSEDHGDKYGVPSLEELGEELLEPKSGHLNISTQVTKHRASWCEREGGGNRWVELMVTGWRPGQVGESRRRGRSRCWLSEVNVTSSL